MWGSLLSPDPARTAYYREQGWWREDTFLDDLARAAQTRPDVPAIIAYEGGKHAATLSYREYAATVDRFAAALAALGVGPGDVVVVHLPNWWMLNPLYLACARVGAVVAPTIPAFAGRELGHVLRASRAKVCIVPDRHEDVPYAQRLADVAPPTLAHRVVVGDAAATGAVDFAELFTRTAHPAPAPHRPRPDDVAVLLFTSGTTGRPKGVAHSYNTLYAATRGISDPYRLGSNDVVSIPHFLTHMAGSTYSVLMSLVIGATCVMQDTSDMGLLLDLVARHGVTFVYAAPMYVLGMLAAQRGQPRDVSALRAVISGSAPIPPQLIADVKAALGVPLGALWGMTENGAVTITRLDDPEGWAAHSDGSPVPWMEVRIDAAPGERIGRLLVRGAAQTLGYLNQRDVYTACLDAEGWFDTGDMARPDGRDGIRITGRRVDLITRANAAKVPVLEVEAVLLHHPAVRDVVLVGYPDPQVPGADAVCAVVVPAGAPPTLDELRGFLDAQQMTDENWPDRVEVVTDLPRNSLGKVLRPVLRDRLNPPGE
jgi:cyclohexanecarboxylate-CoA ligase